VSAEASLARPGRPSAGAGTPAFAAPVCAAALGVTAAYSPKTALEALLAIGLFVLALFRLDVALGLFILLTFPEHLPGSLGVGATLAKPVGAMVAVAWLARAVGRRGEVPLLPRDRPVLFWGVVAFVAFGLFSSLWATSAGATFSDLGRLFQVVVLMLVAYTAAASRGGYRVVVGSYLGASAVTSVFSIATGAYGQNGRLGVLFDPNYFAASLVPAILVSLFLLLSPRSRNARLFAGAICAVDLAALLLTQSRGGLAGLGVALVAGVVVAGSLRPRVVAVVLVCAAAAVGYFGFAGPSHVTSGSSSGRADEWKLAARVAESHPIAGVGLGNYGVVEPSYATQPFDLQHVQYVVTFRQRAHNTYLEVAAEMGIVGLLLIVGILAGAVRSAARELGRFALAADPFEMWVRGLIAGATGMFTAYAFLSAQWEKQLWLVLALLAVTSALVSSPRAASRPPAPPPGR
jgi:O-antigen ligase